MAIAIFKYKSITIEFRGGSVFVSFKATFQRRLPENIVTKTMPYDDTQEKAFATIKELQCVLRYRNKILARSDMAVYELSLGYFIH